MTNSSYALVGFEWYINNATPCGLCDYRRQCHSHPSEYYPCCEVCKHHFTKGECWKETHGGGCNKTIIKLQPQSAILR